MGLLAAGAVLLLGGCAGGSGSGQEAGPGVTPRLAEKALAAGLPDVALHAANAVLANDQGNARALMVKANALYAMHDMAAAAMAYRAALVVDPKSVAAGLGLGRALIRSDPRAAEAAFLDVTARQPGNLSAWNDIGIARDLQGRHDEAQDAYRHALAAAPEAQDIAANLALSLALSGHADQAVSMLRPLAAIPDAPETWRRNLKLAEKAPHPGVPAEPQAAMAAAGSPAPAADSPAAGGAAGTADPATAAGAVAPPPAALTSPVPAAAADGVITPPGRPTPLVLPATSNLVRAGRAPGRGPCGPRGCAGQHRNAAGTADPAYLPGKP